MGVKIAEGLYDRKEGPITAHAVELVVEMVRAWLRPAVEGTAKEGKDARLFRFFIRPRTPIDITNAVHMAMGHNAERGILGSYRRGFLGVAVIEEWWDPGLYYREGPARWGEDVAYIRFEAMGEEDLIPVLRILARSDPSSISIRRTSSTGSRRGPMGHQNGGEGSALSGCSGVGDGQRQFDGN